MLPIDEAVSLLTAAQHNINRQNEFQSLNEDPSTLMFVVVGGTLQVNYFGSFWDDDFTDFVKAIGHRKVAPLIFHLKIDGQDEGANGTRELSLLTLLRLKPDFSSLRHLIISGTELQHHNQTIIGESYDENGQIAHLLSRCPNLLRLEIPSAPNETFFERNEHPLEILKVQAGYDNQNFILNFSQSKCFPNLLVFDYTDFPETSGADFETNPTTLEDYKILFKSLALKNVRQVILRNARCDFEDFNELIETNHQRSILIINTEVKYFTY